MWLRFIETLRCVKCYSKLTIIPFEENNITVSDKYISQGNEIGVSAETLQKYINSGIIICEACKSMYPILDGVPVMLSYKTMAHNDFAKKFSVKLKNVAQSYSFLSDEPAKGEKFILKTFSKEWLDYSYNDVLWIWTYKDREEMFCGEIGLGSSIKPPKNFLEIGCGLGVVTSFAEKHLNRDAVGVDLSYAVFKAAEHFKDNPFLHFVQASVWALPFEEKYFDVIYSHGVLHHTYSTEKAVKKALKFSKDDGLVYVWLYGPGSITDSPARIAAYLLESVLRPILSRLPTPVTNIILSPVALLYVLTNSLQKYRGENRQSYNFSRALHAARDRFTPLFAERVKYEDVEKWFKENGFKHFYRVTENDVPVAAKDTFRRNTGIRGYK